MWSSLKRVSNVGLKICTFCLAICARRSRRMSSSLLPLNMLPVITSIQPACLVRGTSMAVSRLPFQPVPLGARLVLARLGGHPDLVALVDERRNLHDEAGLELG